MTKNESEGLGEKMTHFGSGRREGLEWTLRAQDAAAPVVPPVTCGAGFRWRLLGYLSWGACWSGPTGWNVFWKPAALSCHEVLLAPDPLQEIERWLPC